MHNNPQLPQWTNACSVTRSASNGSPSTEAGTELLNRFSATNDPDTGELVTFTREEAADICKVHYSLSQESIAMITGDNLDKCFPTANYKPKAPTIPVLIDAFGRDMVYEWLFGNIELVIEYCGGRIEIDPFQMNLMSMMLSEKFSEGRNTLNAREIMLFFFKVLKGDFGKFYGPVNPIALGEMASQFLQWRYKQLERVSREEEYSIRKRSLDEIDERCVPMPDSVREALGLLHEKFKSQQ